MSKHIPVHSKCVTNVPQIHGKLENKLVRNLSFKVLNGTHTKTEVARRATELGLDV